MPRGLILCLRSHTYADEVRGVIRNDCLFTPSHHTSLCSVEPRPLCGLPTCGSLPRRDYVRRLHLSAHQMWKRQELKMPVPEISFFQGCTLFFLTLLESPLVQEQCVSGKGTTSESNHQRHRNLETYWCGSTFSMWD